ncbi:hypothetical protein CRUP_029967, partial [Coryphaenoides rupestris]
AVCCEDKQHCCPEGTQCDVRQSRCVSAMLGYSPMLEKLRARRRPASVAMVSVTCPGGKSSCPEGTTCCLLTSGDYGCCPYPEAVCCSDQLHCCPVNTICDLEHKRCLSAEEASFPLATRMLARPNDVRCPDNVTRCSDQTTCCAMVNGSYGCCLMPNAMCCSDHIHCCPEGYNCDLVHSKCVPTLTDTFTASLTPLTSTPARTSSVVAEVKVNNVPCDESAVCCMDLLHCCPHGTTCNLVQSTCDDTQGHAPSLPWLNKLPAHTLTAIVEIAVVMSSDEKCDHQTMCPRGTTCCRKGSGRWACCPLPQAVCCHDQEHCCPQGYRCNLAQQSCDAPGSGRSLPLVRKTPTLPPRADSPSLAGVKCDTRTTCPRDTTCCFMKWSGSWGCCPLPKPHGVGLQRMPWIAKVGAVQQDVPQGMLGDVKCDNSSSCASGTTCCKLATGEWGCCPLIKAVCCDDHEHCCPQGYTCNMHSGTCEKQHQILSPGSRPQSKVVQSMLRQSAEEEDVPCDATGGFRCSKQETCCRTSATEWACCPSAQAVCCTDSQHCCPAGSSCDQAAGSCTPNRLLSWAPQRWDRDADLIPLGL